MYLKFSALRILVSQISILDTYLHIYLKCTQPVDIALKSLVMFTCVYKDLCNGTHIKTTYYVVHSMYVLFKYVHIQSLTKAIIFELFHYINGYFRVQLTSMNIHSKCHDYLLHILINFSWAKSHNFFIMEKSKLTLLFNIC